MIPRKPLQGIINIMRFNWHYYVYSGGLLLVLLIIQHYNAMALAPVRIMIAFVVATVFSSIIVSAYIYDFSDLYKLRWLTWLKPAKDAPILNIHAGFDETSALLRDCFKNSELIAADFYDAEKHTEVSLKRARAAYKPFPGTIQVRTSDLPLSSNSIEKIFAIFSAHEIRNEQERVSFFIELGRLLKPTGEIIVTEHLRDSINFLAYNIGAFHFLTRSTWLKTFEAAGLRITREKKVTPFITIFILEKNAATT